MSLNAKKKKYIRQHHRSQSVIEISKQIQVNPNDVKKYIQTLSPDMDPKRKRLFGIMMLSFPVLFLLILEAALRLFQYGGNTALFITAPGEFSDYYKCNPKVGRRFFMNQSSIPDPPNDIYFKEKPENGYRIFVLGGSTTAGYPYGNNIMFTRILHRRLADAIPDKHIEVVNTATAAINSYTLLDFMDEILKKKPDTILIYAGHNEFYGALGVASTETMGKFRSLIKIILKLRRYKTFLLLRNTIWQLRRRVDKLFRRRSVMDPSATLMERLVAEQNIPFDSSVFDAGKEQFKENIREILKKAKKAAVPVIISELVSNVRDQSPFVSVQTDKYPPAERVYELARSMDAEGKFKEAKQQYYTAKDLDALRFRAPEEFNEIIHRVAGEYDAIIVPMKAYFEAASPEGIIGNHLMLEHLHPNVDGYFVMADAFFQTMHENGMIVSDWDKERIRPASQYRYSWGVTDLDSLYGNLRIRILKGGWPFRPKSAPNRALVDYHAATKAESLAVKVWNDRSYTLERGHVEMAEHYEKQRKYDLAYKEYNALICLTPMNASPYMGAANMLIKQGNLESAFPYLYKSLTLEESGFANKWAGQILLKNNKVKEALLYLEKAYEFESRDPQLLYNLSGAYALSAQYQKAMDRLNELYKISPNFPEADILKRQLDNILKRK